MGIIIGIIILFAVYWIFKKIKSTRGLVGAMMYNEDLGLKPYSEYDMELSKNIKNMGGRIHMSELIVFKWYLLRNVLGVLGTSDVYKMKSIELNQILDKSFFDGFGTELKRFSQQDLEIRLRHFYLSSIPLYIDIDELKHMSNEEIYNSICQDEEVIESISYLLLNGEINELGYSNPIFTIHTSEYIRRNLYMNRVLLRNIALNPAMLTM